MNTKKSSQLQKTTQKKQTTVTFNDIIIVTNNQVKAVVLPEEVTSDQYSLWQDFKDDPLSMPETDFTIVAIRKKGSSRNHKTGIAKNEPNIKNDLKRIQATS